MPTCCDTPKPRIAESTGRMFCANCRRYLDAKPPLPQEPSDTASDAGQGEGSDDAAGQEGEPR